jgi:hypothetical protein
MAPRLKVVWLVVALSAAAASVPRLESPAFAAGLDAKGEVTAKEASGLYRQGLYEEAANLFAKLVVDYPDMVIFERSLGACFYHLHRPEPALSNLRSYLAHRRDIPADDRAVVDRWIDEMEKLRAQNAVVPVAPPPRAESPRGPQPHLDRPPALQPSQAMVLPLPTAEPQPPVALSSATSEPVPSQAQPSPPTAQESVVSAGPQASGTTKGSGLRIAGIACGALGLASIGTAVYYYTRATSLSDKVTGANPASPSDFQAGKDAQTMQWVFYGVGAGALATGAVLYLLGYSQASSTQVGLAPMLGPRTAGLSARGGF